jgi:hypothetical protein
MLGRGRGCVARLNKRNSPPLAPSPMSTSGACAGGPKAEIAMVDDDEVSGSEAQRHGWHGSPCSAPPLARRPSGERVQLHLLGERLLPQTGELCCFRLFLASDACRSLVSCCFRLCLTSDTCRSLVSCCFRMCLACDTQRTQSPPCAPACKSPTSTSPSSSTVAARAHSHVHPEWHAGPGRVDNGFTAGPACAA